MKKVKLSDYIESFGDGIHGTPNYDSNGEYYFINGNNLENNRIQIDNSTLKLSKEEYEKIKRPLNSRTLLVSINGTLGNVAEYNDEKVALGKSVCYLNLKSEKDKNFVRYVILSKRFQKYMMNVAHGSTIKNLAPSQIAEYEFLIPEKFNTNNSVSIIRKIEDKIYNNQKLSVELESLAKTIYDYWFLQFEFTNEEGKPYKSSGGKMVWSEELKREIPEKFVVENIRTKCDIIDCLHSKKPEYHYDKDEYYLLELENLTESGYIDIGTKYYISEDDYRKWTKNIEISENDFVITNAGRTGAIGKIPKGITCALGRNFTAIRPRDINPIYLREYFKSNYFLEQMLGNLDLGSFFKSFNVKSIKQLNILIPEKYVLSQFTEIVAPMISKIENNILENIELSALRDFLLPLLMNGQVTFKDEKECPA